MLAIKKNVITDISGKRTITSLISNPYDVSINSSHEQLSIDLLANPEIAAVAVIDVEKKCTGYISRKSWLEQTAAVLARKMSVQNTIENLITESICLVDSMDPLDVWDKDNTDQLNEELWFTVLDLQGSFKGLFSSKDLLKYLSELLLQDMLLAGKIQSRINKRTDTFKIGNYSLGTFSIPAKGIGGDLVFIKKISVNMVFFSMFDVSGKGHGASIVSALIYGILNLVSIKVDIVTLVKVINRVLLKTFMGELFATGVIGILNSENGMLELVDMGHSHYYFAGSGKQVSLKQTNIPLGVDTNAVIESEQIEIPVNETIVVVSDGIIEQKDSKGMTFAISEMLKRISSSQKQVQDIVQSTLDDYSSFIGLKNQHDDASMIIIRKNLI